MSDFKPVICIPALDGKVRASTLTTVLAARHEQKTGVIYSSHSMFINEMWCEALNARKTHQVTHYCSLHADVSAEYDWLNKMQKIMERTGADVLSVVIPFKCWNGKTSISLDTRGYWKVQNLTLKDVYKLEPTFTDPDILVNTGLMLVDLRKPWVEKVVFTFQNVIVDDAGVFKAHTMTEDYLFSRQAKAAGAKLFATREIAVDHHGEQTFNNTSAWGDEDGT